MAHLHVGTNEFGFPDARILPQYAIVSGFAITTGDILGRTKPNSIIEHRVLVSFNGLVFHSPEPGDVFRMGTLEEVLAPGGQLRIVHPTRSMEETFRRLARAKQILGVPWWNMNCHQTTDFIVGLRGQWLA
jgi:hypothetical protein